MRRYFWTPGAILGNLRRLNGAFSHKGRHASQVWF